jgi:sorbitol/mannitol transport system substrate-binding protein
MFAKPTLEAIESAPIDNPGTSRRPGNPGIQYVGIPQFQSVGDQCTEQFAAVLNGRETINSALANCQNIASAAVGDS